MEEIAEIDFGNTYITSDFHKCPTNWVELVLLDHAMESRVIGNDTWLKIPTGQKLVAVDSDTLNRAQEMQNCMERLGYINASAVFNVVKKLEFKVSWHRSTLQNNMEIVDEAANSVDSIRRDYQKRKMKYLAETLQLQEKNRVLKNRVQDLEVQFEAASQCVKKLEMGLSSLQLKH